MLPLAFYGDDFTGSTDVLEALAAAGVPARLFLAPPSPADLGRWPGLRAWGVAGTSRTMTPGEMDEALPPIFRALGASGAVILHYKVSSTFDSSPGAGSVGRAIEIGREVCRTPTVPLFVASPAFGRYCVFGNLFIRSGLDAEPYRLDRHPTAISPPAGDSDLRVLLGRQTRLRLGLMDVVDLVTDDALARVAEHVRRGVPVLVFDALERRHLAVVGMAISRLLPLGRPLFVTGSSGVEYAIAAQLMATDDTLPPHAFRAPGPVDRLLVASASRAPLTRRQIVTAIDRGFCAMPLDSDAILAGHVDEEIRRLGRSVVAHLGAGQSVIVHAALGPDDPRLRHGAGHASGAARVADALGAIVRTTLEHVPLTRVATTGGDASGRIARALGVHSLEMIAPAAPGAPLCRMHAPGSPADGVEVVFKGGKAGTAAHFEAVRAGHADL